MIKEGFNYYGARSSIFSKVGSGSAISQVVSGSTTLVVVLPDDFLSVHKDQLFLNCVSVRR